MRESVSSVREYHLFRVSKRLGDKFKKVEKLAEAQLVVLASKSYDKHPVGSSINLSKTSFFLFPVSPFPWKGL